LWVSPPSQSPRKSFTHNPPPSRSSALYSSLLLIDLPRPGISLRHFPRISCTGFSYFFSVVRPGRRRPPQIALATGGRTSAHIALDQASRTPLFSLPVLPAIRLCVYFSPLGPSSSADQSCQRSRRIFAKLQLDRSFPKRLPFSAQHPVASPRVKFGMSPRYWGGVGGTANISFSSFLRTRRRPGFHAKRASRRAYPLSIFFRSEAAPTLDPPFCD